MNKDYLIDKWSFMLFYLDQKKANQISYAKIFEHTSLNSSTNTIKLVLSILLKILFYIPNLKFSPSHKNELFIGSIEKNLIIDGLSIMPDSAIAFIDYILKTIKQKYESNDLTKINCIRLIEKQGFIEIHAIF